MPIKQPDWPLQRAAEALKQFTDGGRLLSENGCITEIYGESGCGKTQLALYLTACTLATGCSGVVYVSTESMFPIERLMQMLASAFPEARDLVARQRMLDNLYLEHAYDLDVQWHVLRYQLPHLIHVCATASGDSHCRYPIRLIVIDSIAANYRYGLEEEDDDDNGDNDNDVGGKTDYCGTTLHLLRNKVSTADRRIKAAAQRNRQLYELGAWLKHLGYRYGVTVLTVNQVTGVSAFFDPTNSIVLQPALGQTWTACVNTRLSLGRCRCGQQRRLLKVIFAPHLPADRTLCISLTTDGLIRFEPPSSSCPCFYA